MVMNRRATLAVLAWAGALGCGGGFDTDPALEPLAKVEGWRDDLQPVGDPYAIVEIAYDRESAELAWRQNVPDDIGGGGPPEAGVVGDLDRVDFECQAVIVWSSGESGSCPGWLADFRARPDGRVAVETDYHLPRLSDACTADYRPYRMVIAVDRNRLPPADALPIDEVVGIPDGLVDRYPTRQISD